MSEISAKSRFFAKLVDAIFQAENQRKTNSNNISQKTKATMTKPTDCTVLSSMCMVWLRKNILRFWLGSKNIFKVPDPVQKNLFTVSVPCKWFQVPSTESHWAWHIFKMKKYKMLLNLIWITKCYWITYIPAEILRLTNITVKSPCPHGLVFFFETQNGQCQSLLNKKTPVLGGRGEFTVAMKTHWHIWEWNTPWKTNKFGSDLTPAFDGFLC